MPDPATITTRIDQLDYSGLRILPEYIDHNGHLNAGYYLVLFDRALSYPWRELGIDSEACRAAQRSTFALESRVIFKRELLPGQPLAFDFVVLDYDHKRLHFYQTICHATEGWVAAICEQVSICIDMQTRRSAPWLPEVEANIAALHEADKERPLPAEIGRKLGLQRR